MSKFTLTASAAALSLVFFAAASTAQAQRSGCNVERGGLVTQNVTTNKKVETKASGMMSSASTNIGSVDCGTVRGQIRQNVTVKGKVKTKASGLGSRATTNIGSIK